jgi:hypothetical protein
MIPKDPKDPAQASAADPRSPFAPPFVDEDAENEMVQLGLDEAEDETREAVADAYQASALESAEPEESLNDIDFTESEDDS